MANARAQDHPAAGPGRPRRAETDEQILRATLELVREVGPHAVNVASVSARSGVARTTIYRRFTDRQALLRAALGSLTERGTPPTDTSLQAKIDWVLSATEQVVVSGLGPGGIAAVLAGGDEEYSHVLRGALAAGLEPVRSQIAADLDSGRIVAEEAFPAAEMVIDIAVGTCVAQLVRHGALSASWHRRTAALLIRLLSPEP